MSPFIVSYAETHYTAGPLIGRYFMRAPEVIADLPHRYVKDSLEGLPVALIVKDAHRWPLKLHNITAHIHSGEGVRSHRFELRGKTIDQRYWSQVLYVPLGDIAPTQTLRVNVRIVAELRGKTKVWYNDNYRGLPWAPFECWYAGEPLPLPHDWRAGDPHYHSSFTDDQAEFGADPAITAIMARALGLSWFFVTDHSYDLDDRVDDYLRADPALPKWSAMIAACRAADSPDLRVMFGEEVSIGNARGENVHMLVVNDPRYHPGDGDSAERPFRNRPTTSLRDFEYREGSLVIPAHPFDPTPREQRLTLRRGDWAEDDFYSVWTHWMEAVNGGEPAHVRRCIDRWCDMLLAGHKFLIVAGNDAHGNFNCMRQIAVPMLRLFRARRQMFGEWFTAFRHHQNDPVAGFEGREIIISNGPFLSFTLQGQSNTFHIGQEANERHLRLRLEHAVSPQFGEVREIALFIGDMSGRRETKETSVRDGMSILAPPGGYVRMELTTTRGGLAVTNPVFIAEDNR